MTDEQLIVKDPEIQFGQATIKGTRITVSTIQGLSTGGEPVDFIARLYEITEEMEALDEDREVVWLGIVARRRVCDDIIVHDVMS